MTGSSAPGRPTDRSRRAVLATAIASAVGTAGCSWSGDDEGYDRSDHEMTFGLECVDPAAGRYVARLGWGGRTGRTDRLRETRCSSTGMPTSGSGSRTARRPSAAPSWTTGGVQTPTDGPTSNSFTTTPPPTPTGNTPRTSGYRRSATWRRRTGPSSAYVHRTQEGGPYYPDYSEGSEWTSEGGKWNRTAESSQTAAACPEEGT